jgi:hypothetical protein
MPSHPKGSNESTQPYFESPPLNTEATPPSRCRKKTPLRQLLDAPFES